jgi:hypothetical protein
VEYGPRARPTGSPARATRGEAVYIALRQRAVLPENASGTKPLAEPEALYCNCLWRGGVSATLRAVVQDVVRSTPTRTTVALTGQERLQKELLFETG